MAYDYGGYERQKSDIYNQYGTQASTNAYGRFLGQQRGQRNLGDMSRAFKRQTPMFKSQWGQRGLGAGQGIKSGIERNAMSNYVGDYAQNYGRAQQDMTQELQQADLQQVNLDAWRQQSLASLEADKAKAIANDAQNLEWLRQMMGSI